MTRSSLARRPAFVALACALALSLATQGTLAAVGGDRSDDGGVEVGVGDENETVASVTLGVDADGPDAADVTATVDVGGTNPTDSTDAGSTDLDRATGDVAARANGSVGSRGAVEASVASADVRAEIEPASLPGASEPVPVGSSDATRTDRPGTRGRNATGADGPEVAVTGRAASEAGGGDNPTDDPSPRSRPVRPDRLSPPAVASERGLPGSSPTPTGAGAAAAAVLAAGALASLSGTGTAPLDPAVGDPAATRRAFRAGLARVRGRLGDAPWTPVGPLAGYSRHDSSDPLENDVRAAIHEAVTDSPGVYYAKLADATGVARETVRYHARILEEEELVVQAKVRGRRRLYPTTLDGPDLRLAAALEDQAAAAVLDAVVRMGPASVSELADALERAPSTVSHHLDRLEDDGLLSRERDGNYTVVRPSPAVTAAFDGDAAPAD